MIPPRRELAASGTYTVDPLVLDLGAPAAGYQWDLRRLLVLDQAKPWKARTATVLVVTPNGTGSSSLNAIEIADASPCGLPAPGTWSRGTIVLGPGEHVQAWVYGAPTGLAIIATAQVEEDRYP